MAEATAPDSPASGPKCESRLRGLTRFLKGVLYVIPGLNLIPIAYDSFRALRAYDDERLADNSRENALYSGGCSGGIPSGLGLMSYITGSALFSWIPGIYYGLTGLWNTLAPEGIDNPVRGERNYVKALGYTPSR